MSALAAETLVCRARLADLWQRAVADSGRSVSSIAREIGVPRSTLASNLERGSMSIVDVCRLAIALDLELWELF